MNNRSINHYTDQEVDVNSFPYRVGNSKGDFLVPSQQRTVPTNRTNYKATKAGMDPGYPNLDSQNINEFSPVHQQPAFDPGLNIQGNFKLNSNAPNALLPRYGNKFSSREVLRKTMLQNQKFQMYSQPGMMGGFRTPALTYDVPSSPNVNPMSSVSINNNSDLSDSNLLDQQHQLQVSYLAAPSHDELIEEASTTMRDVPQEKSVHQKHISNDSHQIENPGSTPTAGTGNLQPPEKTNEQTPEEVQGVQQISREEQHLATKLKDTYRNIVNFEEIIQRSCIEVSVQINNIIHSESNSGILFGSPNLVVQPLSSRVSPGSAVASLNSKTTGLLNRLWSLYHHNIILLDSYFDFLMTALKPKENTETNFRMGKKIVELYKIPRRMWVYGIVGFLEVLKNVLNIFQEHEVCLCFIAFCFNVMSNLTEPSFEMEGWWSEKLGDLSRMAIALYTSSFIDWKISSEYWYSIAMRSLYGHGKTYYHMSTVQQDNLEALVNISKSVVCHDPFVPTQQYLRLVVENICTQRNILSLLELPIIDFIKIHKVLLSINSNFGDSGNGSSDLINESQVQYGIDLVTRYGLTFGSDSSGFNFFTKKLFDTNGDPTFNEMQSFYSQYNNSASLEKIHFWFSRGPSFAVANINHLIGFGDSRNPFAKLFRLPEALRERKVKKDRKRKPTNMLYNDNSTAGANNMGGEIPDMQLILSSELDPQEWFYSLHYVNKSVLELSFRILNFYLIGPKQASTAHVIVWLYFLIAVGLAMEESPNSKPLFLWLFRKLFPWNSFLNYLNSVLMIIRQSERLTKICRSRLSNQINIDDFNSNETLSEVWKCWGTVWFDFIAPKADYTNFEEAGVKNIDIFELPTSGILSSLETSMGGSRRAKSTIENEERIVRIFLLARHLADNFEFGLVRTKDGFRFDEQAYFTTDDIVRDTNGEDVYSYLEIFLLGDNRFLQHNFLQRILPDFLVRSNEREHVALELDDAWFNVHGIQEQPLPLYASEPVHEDEHDFLDYAPSDLEDEELELGVDFQDVGQGQRYQQSANAYYPPREQGTDYGLYPESYNAPYNLSPDHDEVIPGDLGDGVDTKVTYITLDTNMWLKHCGRILKCVQDGVIKVLVPLIVFQELRSLRRANEVTIVDAATRAVIIIRVLYYAGDLLPLRFDGTIASDINETMEFENNSTWRTTVDDTILNSINEHDHLGKKLLKGVNQPIGILPNRQLLSRRSSKSVKYCILVTDDRNMNLKAKTIGLSCFSSKWLFAQLEANFTDRCID